jgi:transposase
LLLVVFSSAWKDGQGSEGVSVSRDGQGVVVCVAVFAAVCREDAGQGEHELRDVFDAVRYVARSGCAWRMIPGDLPPWAAVYQQFRRWLDAGVFEALVSDAQSIAREWAGRKGQPSAICIDSRTLQSTPESGARAGYDGAKRRKGSKVHIAVDTLGHPAGPDRHTGRPG